jgi:hypothetical protein
VGVVLSSYLQKILVMLSLSQFHKEVGFKTNSLQCNVNCVYAYVADDNYKLTLIPKEQFGNYQFIGYRYERSYFPNVKKI